jgi:hypothetical protein
VIPAGDDATTRLAAGGRRCDERHLRWAFRARTRLDSAASGRSDESSTSRPRNRRLAQERSLRSGLRGGRISNTFCLARPLRAARGQISRLHPSLGELLIPSGAATTAAAVRSIALRAAALGRSEPAPAVQSRAGSPAAVTRN